jgi:protein-S-isoprenylcysteine O-methyltransferase Ste14
MKLLAWGARAVYELRGPLVAVPVLGAAILPRESDDNLLLAWGIGLLLFGIGWSVRIWAQGHLGYRLQRSMTLTRCGPYAYVRNPIYLANTAMALGAVAASGAIVLLPVALAWVLGVYAVTVRHEEAALARRYGEPYRRYLREVHRWLPAPRQPLAPCGHRVVAEALFAELHTPLIMGPAALKAMHLFTAAGLAYLRGMI